MKSDLKGQSRVATNLYSDLERDSLTTKEKTVLRGCIFGMNF